MLDIQNLSKTYARGNKEALKHVNLTIKEGEFTALLGHNGAGKSTLINVIAGNVKKTTGLVTIGGYDLEKDELETKKVIGVVPQEVGVDFTFTVDEILRNQSGYFGLGNNSEYIEELLEALALKDKRKARVRELSGGMKRRLLIAKALVHKPKLLILDEPTAGVDIELRHSMYEFLNKLHQSGTTIILTTHYIEEAEKLCKRIIIINNGEIIADEPKEQLIEKFSKEVTVEVHFDTKVNENDIAFLAQYKPKLEEKTKLYLTVHKRDLNEALDKILKREMKISNLIVERQKLEDIYLNLVNY